MVRSFEKMVLFPVYSSLFAMDLFWFDKIVSENGTFQIQLI